MAEAKYYWRVVIKTAKGRVYDFKDFKIFDSYESYVNNFISMGFKAEVFNTFYHPEPVRRA